MTIEEIMSPFAVFFDWMKNTTFYLGQYPFTFYDWFVWFLFASLVIGVIVKIRD